MMKRIVIIICTTALFLPFANQLMAETNPSEWPIVLMQDVKSAIRQAEARFQSGNVSGAADLARRILEKYPNNADAQAILDKCITMEKSDYDAAIKSLNVEQLEAFQKKYPSSSYNDSIERHIDDVPLWNIARKGNTIESYNRYLSESSHHLFKQEANDAIRDITVKQAYDAAVAANTVDAFLQFRKSFPESIYDKAASNKIARLMADRFNSRSSYSDLNGALAYAQDEMARDYVRNKYHKATDKTSSKTSSSTSRTTSTRSTTTQSSSSSQRSSSNSTNSRYKKTNSNPAVLLGIDLSAEWWPSAYKIGAGPILRLGRQSSMFFATVSAQYSIASCSSSYSDYSYDYGHETITLNGDGNYLSVPITLNWNFSYGFGTSYNLYMGMGYVYNSLLNSESSVARKNPSAYLIQLGGYGRHFDLKGGASMYTKPIINSGRVDDLIMLYLGMSFYF